MARPTTKSTVRPGLPIHAQAVTGELRTQEQAHNRQKEGAIARASWIRHRDLGGSELVFGAQVLVEQSPQFSSFFGRLDWNPILIIARAGCLGLWQQLAGMDDEFGDFEGLYQEGNTVFLQE